MALPDTGRPSISRWRPRKLTTAAAKASPRVSNRSVASSILAAWAGIEPGAEGEHARRERRIGDEREIALDRRLRVQTIPGDEDLRLAAQHQRRTVEFGVGPRELRLELVNAARPDSAADEMEDRGDRRQQHQRQDDEADDIGLDRGQVERDPRRSVQRLGEVLARRPARPRTGKARGPRPRAAATAQSSRRVRSPIPERFAPLNPRNESPPRKPGADAVRRPGDPPTPSLRPEGPNQSASGLRNVCRKVVNHRGAAQRSRRGLDASSRG